MDNISDFQPHIVTKDDNGNAHVIPMWLVRQVASGQRIADNDLSRVIAVALLDSIGDDI